MRDIEMVHRFGAGERPLVRYQRDLGACGAKVRPKEIRIGWDAGVNPYVTGEQTDMKH